MSIVTLYSLLLFKVTICPIIFLRQESKQMVLQEFGDFFVFYQLIPFRTIGEVIEAGTWMRQILGNVLLLFPIPMLHMLCNEKVLKIRNYVMIGAAVSLSIEAIQWIINMLTQYPSHVADVDDVIVNVFGVFVSAVLVQFLGDSAFVRKLKMIIK